MKKADNTTIQASAKGGPPISTSGYSIFDESMVAMTFTEIEEAINRGAIVIWPIGGLCQNGPHLPLSINIYQGSMWARLIRQELERRGVETLIAPQYFWPNDTWMTGFIGSFTIKPEIVQGALEDGLRCFKRWGVKNVFFTSWFSENEMSIMAACKTARKDFDLEATFLLPEFRAYKPEYKLTGKEEHVIIMPSEENSTYDAEFLELHACSREVGYMLAYFPDLVDINLAKALRPTNISLDELIELANKPGGFKENIPGGGGYIGNPAGYNVEEAKSSFDDSARRAAITIEAAVKGAYKPPETFKPYKPKE